MSELIYFTNRASAVYRAALEPLGGRPFVEGDPRIDFMYFDGYGGNKPPSSPGIGMTLMERRMTIPLDNKAQMARILRDAGRDRPQVHFDPATVPADSEKLWFVKNPLASAGRDLHCVPAKDIARHFKKNFIIQEAITSLDLIDDRKYTLRAYVLVTGGSLYLYPEGIIIVHGARYEEGNTDADVQFVHDGYMDPGSDVTMLRFSEHSKHAEILPCLERMVIDSFLPFRDILDNSPNTYCLFGIDALVESSLDTVLIEINDRPNILHTKEINARVNAPMIQSMMAVFSARFAAATAGQAQFRKLCELGDADASDLHG